MRKALFVAPTPFFSDRGCHIRIYEEARWLKRLGVDIRILTYSSGRDLPELEIKRAGSWVKYKKLEAGPSWRKPFIDYSLLLLLREQIKEFQPDLIHCHLQEGAFLAIFSAAKSIPIILDYQGSLSLELSQHQRFFRVPPIPKLFKGIESWINSRVDWIFLNCSSLKSELNLQARSKSTIVRDGVDTERFSAQKPDPELRKMLGLKRGSPVIVYLGLLNEYQGVDLLLRSAKIVLAKNPGAQFLIMGYPLVGYPRKAQEMGLGDSVKFSGRVDYFQAEKFLALGDIAVAPKISRTEANGKLLNYLAMGLPVVCFDREVNQELAGECAEYVKYLPEDFEKSAEGLAFGILNLVENPSRRQELSERGRERAVREFGWDKVAERILRCYEEILVRCQK